MVSSWLAVALLLIGGDAPPEDVVSVTARLSESRLIVGEAVEISLEISIRDGWAASEAGVPKPILQILVPEGVRLEGRHLTEYRELSRNEFLQSPFERLVDVGTQSIRFTLESEPAEDAIFAFNVLAYVSQDPTQNAWFIRRRVELALKPGASSKKVASFPSTWSGKDGLAIGEKAAAFVLPRSDGSTVDLSEYLGKRPILVTTYRAFW